jgi:APA family basic amino acid/polyamine antiporter
VAVFAIYFTLPWIALSALPVHKDSAGNFVTKLGQAPDAHGGGGFKNDPVLGLVENLGLHGQLLDAAKIYVGVLAATILFIATNAGVIGASRITYSMASYRQLPEVFRRLHPRFKTPWLSLVVFAGLASIAFLLPGNVDFIGRMYAFGAMLSFTVAHAAVVALRYKRREEEVVFRARPNLRYRGVDWPLFAIFGGLGTGIAWLVVVVQDAPTRYAGLGWLVVGFAFYALFRKRFVHVALVETVRAPLPVGRAIALEYRNILVPVADALESEEAVDLACRLAAERGASIVAVTVIEVPLELPLDARLPEDERRADELLDEARAIGDSYGVRVVGRLLRARRAGRAIVDEAERRQTEIIVIGAPRKQRRGQRGIFGDTVDFVLKHAPCRVMVVAAPKSKAA